MYHTITITYSATGHVISSADNSSTIQEAQAWFNENAFDATSPMLPLAVILGEILNQYGLHKHIGWIPVIQYIMDEISELETNLDPDNPANHDDDPTPKPSSLSTENDWD